MFAGHKFSKVPYFDWHDLSKKTGEELAINWAAKTLADFIKMRKKTLEAS
jgi:hypothetical protein